MSSKDSIDGCMKLNHCVKARLMASKLTKLLSGAQFSIFFNFSVASSLTSYDMASSKNKWQFTCIKDCDLVKWQHEKNASSFEMRLAGETSMLMLLVMKKSEKNCSMLNIYNSILHNIDVDCRGKTLGKTVF